ncbi:MAG TPA: hypothetical protein PLC48_13225 [Ferruginibacter sp.]|nr:hypothetical protein [Ferruginibacter sp.]
MEPIKKQADRKTLIYSVLWAFVYMGCLIVLKKAELSKSAGILLSFVPTVFFVLFIYHYIRSISTMDEVERRIQLEATVWGFSLGLLLLMTLGLLDLVVVLKKEDWSFINLIPMFFLFYVIGIFISRRKYNGA